MVEILICSKVMVLYSKAAINWNITLTESLKANARNEIKVYCSVKILRKKTVITTVNVVF